MSVREDTVRRKNGDEGLFGVVDKPDFVVIVPIDDDGGIYLVEQYRYPVAERCWELPQGSWEGATDADPVDVAAGELKEETGLIAKTIRYVSKQYLACGYSNQAYHIYVAQGLRQARDKREIEEQDLVAKKFSMAEFEQMIVDNRIKDATTICAYTMAKIKKYI